MPKSQYSPKFAEYMLTAFAEQDRGLAPFCDGDDEWPSSTTVWRWQQEHEEFREQVLLFREMQLERMMYSSISDLDHVEVESVGPGHANALVAQRSKVAELRMKLAQKMVPKKFHEKIAVDLESNVTGKVTLTIGEEDLEEIDEDAVRDSNG